MSAVIAAPASFSPKYQVGNKVWFVSTHTTSGRHPCPDCGDTQKWSVTSPAGVAMDMDCPRCTRRHSYNDALNLSFEKHVPQVRDLTIGSVQIDTASENPISYMCEETGIGSGLIYYEPLLFDSKEAADKEAAFRCAELQAKADAVPVAMERVNNSLLGYFEAQERGLESYARETALRNLRSEFEGSFAKGEHTPGVWYANGGASDDGVFNFTIYSDNLSGTYYKTKQICSGYGGLSDGFASKQEGPANARLLSAAPDLLFALKALYEATPDNEGGALGEACRLSRAAIAKTEPQ